MSGGYVVGSDASTKRVAKTTFHRHESIIRLLRPPRGRYGCEGHQSPRVGALICHASAPRRLSTKTESAYIRATRKCAAVRQARRAPAHRAAHSWVRAGVQAEQAAPGHEVDRAVGHLQHADRAHRVAGGGGALLEVRPARPPRWPRRADGPSSSSRRGGHADHLAEVAHSAGPCAMCTRRSRGNGSRLSFRMSSMHRAACCMAWRIVMPSASACSGQHSSKWPAKAPEPGKVAL